MTKKDEYGFNNYLQPNDISYTNKLNPNKNKIKTIIYSNKQRQVYSNFIFQYFYDKYIIEDYQKASRVLFFWRKL